MNDRATFTRVDQSTAQYWQAITADTLGCYNHPDLAAAILKPFVSEAKLWMVQNHGIFQGYNFFHHIGLNRDMRDDFSGHVHYTRTEEFIALYDNPAFDAQAETLPIGEFEPMLRRVFTQPRNSIYKAALEKQAQRPDRPALAWTLLSDASMTQRLLYHPGDPVDWPAVREALAGLPLDDSDAARERAASDYHWYSPILAEQLQGKRPDLVVRPRDVAEVLQLAAVCARHRVPLTVRGGGTGNYGQCVPLYGGIVMDATALNRVLHIEPGWATVETGVLLHDLNLAARHIGQQLRMWPSTERIATVGGFIAGGHSGIGSIRHGILADRGNVRRLRIVTLQDPPQQIDLLDADIQKAHHAYGSNGIITELEIALTEWVEWQHTITLFDSYDAVLRFGLEVGRRGIDVFQLSAVERRITPYYAGLRDRLEDADAMFAQVAADALAAYEALARQMGGRLVVRGTEAELLAEGLPSATECAYNHTTLEALKSDRGVTYLQVAYPGPLDADLVAAQMRRFGDELYFHHEFSRAGGELVAFALPLLHYFDAAQLRDLIASFEADGCRIFDPHTFVLEDGGMKQVDEAQLAFKLRADPQGLMNPGKLRAWNERVLGRAA